MLFRSEKTVSEVKDDPGWDKKIEAGHAVGDDAFYKAWDAAVTQEKETDDIDPYSLAFRMMGNCVYMLAHAGFTKKQIVYNIDAPFDAAQEEFKELEVILPITNIAIQPIISFGRVGIYEITSPPKF
mgnify:CR=1 FL=1